MQRTNIYLDEDQLRILKHLSAEENKSVADLVRQAVDNFLSERLAAAPLWKEDMESLLARFRGQSSKRISSDEVELDVRAALGEVREARNERGH